MLDIECIILESLINQARVYSRGTILGGVDYGDYHAWNTLFNNVKILPRREKQMSNKIYNENLRF